MLQDLGYANFNPSSREYIPSPRLSFLDDWSAGGDTNR